MTANTVRVFPLFANQRSEHEPAALEMTDLDLRLTALDRVVVADRYGITSEPEKTLRAVALVEDYLRYGKVPPVPQPDPKDPQPSTQDESDGAVAR